jgi:hypothetical protein
LLKEGKEAGEVKEPILIDEITEKEIQSITRDAMH